MWHATATVLRAQTCMTEKPVKPDPSLQSNIKNPHSLFIGGHWVKPATARTLSVISPVTEEVLVTFAEATQPDIDRAVAAARQAFDKGPWPRMSAHERAAALLEVAKALRDRHEELARAWTGQVGAAISFTRYASAQPAGLFEYCANL